MSEPDEQQYYEWSAYYDDEGRLYYYNGTTEESSWEAPEVGFNPPPENTEENEEAVVVDDGHGNVEEVQLEEEKAATSPINSPGPTSPTSYPESPMVDEDDDSGPTSPTNIPDPMDTEVDLDTNTDTIKVTDNIKWIAYKDEEGQEYYYDNETGETQWEKPDNYIPAEELEDAAEHDVKEEPGEQDEPEQQQMSPVASEQSPSEDEEEEPKEPEIDPEVVKLQEAEEALNKPDSILEPSCIANVSVVVPAHGGNPGKAIKALIDSYHGQTAVCGLLARWFVEFKHQTTVSTNLIKTETSKTENINKKLQKQDKATTTNYNEADANYIRDLATEVINRIANEKFSREAGDGILDLGKSDAAFLEEMMDSPRWRKLLIDLSASHKDSAVLLHCLRAISKRGHHREISKRINQSDHFAVFNAMLLSELAVIGKVAVSAGNDLSSSSGFEELLHDLQRACSATSYTYLYSVEMLRTLEEKALDEVSKDFDLPLHECRFKRAIRKWQALSQLLESAMVDPGASQSIAGSSPLFRKRRLDVALTISELHQRQRRRKLNDSGHERLENGSKDDQKDLETALLMLLRRYSTGTQIGDAVLDKLLPTGLDLNTRDVGKLLLNHPLAIRALLGQMYKPGNTRVNSPGTKNKCARLVALSVLAAEQIAREDIMKHQHENGESGEIETLQEDEIDEVALTRMIVQGSQLCEQIETMISFSVTTESQQNIGIVSPGQKLCSLALKCAPVGLGAMMWAREFTHGPEFAQSASFPTISPSVMSLVRIIALRHPFTRTDALEVALAFLRHTNPDISYQKVNLIKEQSLRLMVFLLIAGDVAPVLSNITNRLSKSGTSELDASLVRYFVGSVLEVVKPPFSPVFIRLFSSLLNAPRTIDAVRSTYFAKDNRLKLGSMLQSFTSVKLPDGSPLWKEDTSLISTLLTTYQIE